MVKPGSSTWDKTNSQSGIHIAEAVDWLSPIATHWPHCCHGNPNNWPGINNMMYISHDGVIQGTCVTKDLCDVVISISTNRSIVFFWKLCCHWLKCLWWHHIVLVTQAPGKSDLCVSSSLFSTYCLRSKKQIFLPLKQTNIYDLEDQIINQNIFVWIFSMLTHKIMNDLKEI